LAICKPAIRRTAKAGDWVVGIGPANKRTRGKVVYAMEVGEVKRFYYFGREVVALPRRLALVGKGGQGHRSWFPATYIEMLSKWLEKEFVRGIHGGPEAMVDLEKCGGC
jgi:hypothetical protein